jgi:hypothetical protein
VLTLIPRLNEVIFGDIMQDFTNPATVDFKYSKEQLIKSLNKMMMRFGCYKKVYTARRRDMSFELDCDGNKGNFVYSDVLSINVTVTKCEDIKPLVYEPKMFICCLN